jgi:Uma2 family endonuclease
LGLLLPGSGVIFAEDQAVIPDLVWVSRERFSRVIGRDGKLHRSPDLVIEILSPGPQNEERDREVKLKLYSRQGVREYWILDPADETVAIYRRVELALQLVATLTASDSLTSPLLPGFSCPVQELFPPELQLEPEEGPEADS